MEEYINNFIKKELEKIGLKDNECDKKIYNRVLNIISQALYEYRVPTDDFLNEITKSLEKTIGGHWKITHKNRTISISYREVAPALMPDGSGYSWYTSRSDIITGKQITYNDFNHLFAEGKDTDNTSERPYHEDAYETVGLNALSQMTDDNWYDIYKYTFIEILEHDKLKIEQSIYNKLLQEYISMYNESNDYPKLINTLNENIKRCNELVNNCYSKEYFEDNNSRFYSKEYREHMKLPTASQVESSINFFNYLKPVDDSKLQLEEDENGIRNGYNVCASWTWCDDFDDICELVFVKAPDELLKISELFNNIFKGITIQYEMVGKPKIYNMASYSRHFREKDFEKEKGIRIRLLNNNKQLNINYVKKKIDEVNRLSKELREKRISSIGTEDVYDKIEFKDNEFVSADESRKLFLENGWVEGECSNWLGDIINEYLDQVEQYTAELSTVIKESEENKIRTQYLNQRAIFYDKLYRSYGRKLKLLDKIDRLIEEIEKANIRQETLNKLRQFLVNNNLLSLDINSEGLTEPLQKVGIPDEKQPQVKKLVRKRKLK